MTSQSQPQHSCLKKKASSGSAPKLIAAIVFATDPPQRFSACFHAASSFKESLTTLPPQPPPPPPPKPPPNHPPPSPAACLHFNPQAPARPAEALILQGHVPSFRQGSRDVVERIWALAEELPHAPWPKRRIGRPQAGRVSRNSCAWIPCTSRSPGSALLTPFSVGRVPLDKLQKKSWYQLILTSLLEDLDILMLCSRTGSTRRTAQCLGACHRRLQRLGSISQG